MAEPPGSPSPRDLSFRGADPSGSPAATRDHVPGQTTPQSDAGPQPTDTGEPASGRLLRLLARTDRVLHEPVRLAIAFALASGTSPTFADLRRALDLTDGNLGAHLGRLAEVGYVEITRTGTGRTARCRYALTRAGRRALDRYRAQLELVATVLRGVQDR